jgi:hypothetical protein
MIITANTEGEDGGVLVVKVFDAERTLSRWMLSGGEDGGHLLSVARVLLEDGPGGE